MYLQLYSLVALSLGYHISLALAGGEGRGKNPHKIPAICNTTPDILGVASTGNPKSGVVGRSESSAAILATGRKLSRRAGVIQYDASCNAGLPTQSRYGTGFPTRKSVVVQAYNDAVELANQASVIRQTSKAYTNYFDAINDGQRSHFGRMMTQIADSVPFFHITFECSGTGGDCGSNRVVASTDATAGDNKVINLCESFFTVAQTKFFLYDKSKGSNPGVPFRDNSATGWCNNNLKSNFYATAGHTILHELTHLDALAAASGLDAPTEGDDAGRHGTDDLQVGCQLQGARAYKDLWDAAPEDENNPNFLASPDYNAESYAAAATENYFMNLCGFSSIPK